MSNNAVAAGASVAGRNQLHVTCSADTPFAAAAGRDETAPATMTGSAGPGGVTVAYAFHAAVVRQRAAAGAPAVVTISY
jgi:hypothetical protein